jgi:hypothetical protein
MSIFCESTPELLRWLKRITAKGAVTSVVRCRGGFVIEFTAPDIDKAVL